MMTEVERQELRRWSAEGLMGFKSSEPFGVEWMGEGLPKIVGLEKELWNPLTTLNQAFMVVDRMRELGWFLNLSTSASNADMWVNNKPIASDCYVYFYRYSEGGDDPVEGPTRKDRNSATAILLAAKAAEDK